MFCRYCGKEISPDIAFCTGCGNAIVPLVKEWSYSLLIIIILSTLIIPLVGFVFGIIGMTQPQRRIQGIILIALSIFTFTFWSTLVY